MREKNQKKKKSNFEFFFCCPSSPILNLWGITSVPGHRLKKNLYSHEANQIFNLQKKFKKIMTKIQPIGTCLKSHLSPEETMVL